MPSSSRPMVDGSRSPRRTMETATFASPLPTPASGSPARTSRSCSRSFHRSTRRRVGSTRGPGLAWHCHGAWWRCRVARSALIAIRGRAARSGSPFRRRTEMATIVIVEDQPDNLKLLITLLTLKGHQVIGLPNGDSVAEVLRTHQPTPRLVLLDIQLPGRDGFAVLEELKALPERCWKVVALTAHALPEDRARAAAAGFDGYITKPIDVRTLPTEVARYLGG